MKLVVKIGGSLLETPGQRLRIAEQIGWALRDGHQVLLVHGGGKQLSRYLEHAGIPSRFLDGLRVTTAEAIDGVVKVFAGTVNHELLAALHQAHVPAVGISGIDAGCLLAEKLLGERGEDWGFVGKIARADPRLWKLLFAGGMLPVMACIAVGAGGEIYNVNADRAAVACATSLRADGLIFLTDVDGIRGRDGATVPRLEGGQIPCLLESGAVTGGMLAKLNAVQEALAQGIVRIHIGNGHENGCLQNGILACAEAIEGGSEEGCLKAMVPGTTVLATAPVAGIPARPR